MLRAYTTGMVKMSLEQLYAGWFPLTAISMKRMECGVSPKGVKQGGTTIINRP